jgi:glucan phosphorylase
MEASGTSGMKAAVHQVPSLSVLDDGGSMAILRGTGWVVGEGAASDGGSTVESASLYDKLEGRQARVRQMTWV